MVDILPGINDPDFEHITEKLSLVAPYASWVHIDISDGTYTNTHTFTSFSDQWKNVPKQLSYEAHLMVANPEKYIKPLVDCGFARVLAHVECQDPRRFLEEAQFEEIEVGLVLDGPSPVEEIEPFLNEIDVAMLMSYEAGPSGQKFWPETIEKIKAIHHHFPETLIEVDGAVTDLTAPIIVAAGAGRLVVTTYMFKDPRLIKSKMESLSSLGE